MPVELAGVLAEVRPAGAAGDVAGIVVQPGEASFVISHVRPAARDFVGMDDAGSNPHDPNDYQGHGREIFNYVIEIGHSCD